MDLFAAGMWYVGGIIFNNLDSTLSFIGALSIDLNGSDSDSNGVAQFLNVLNFKFGTSEYFFF